jgi:ABC-type transport system substrate-binding protein
LNSPRTKNPFIGSDADTIAYMPIYEPLLVLHGVTGEIMPLLAKTWDWDEPTLTYTFHIDPEAKFNNGEPVTAEDVKYSWETAWNVAAKATEVKAMVDSINVVDAKTVNFVLKDTYADFLRYMGYTYIVPKAIWEAQDVMTWENPEPVGSGPMFWTEYVLDDHCTFTTNPNYWGGKIYIDALVLQYYGDVNLQLLALRRGDIDCVNKLQMNSAVPTLMMEQNMEIAYSELNYTQQLLLNIRKAPMSVVDFRKAMNVIIDRSAMVTTVMSGYGIVPLQVPIAPAVACANKDLLWPYEDKTAAERTTIANALLDPIPGMTTIALGDGTYRKYNGNLVQLTLMHSNTAPESIRTAEIVQSSCALLGIKINLEPQSFVTAFGKVYRHKGDPVKILAWDMFITGAPYTPDFSSFHNNYVYPEPAPLASGGVWRDRLFQSEAIGWTNATIQGKFAQQATEMDPVVRLALQKEIQALWAAQMPSLQMYHTITPMPYRTDHFTGWLADMPTVVYNKNVEGYWSPYHLLALRPV